MICVISVAGKIFIVKALHKQRCWILLRHSYLLAQLIPFLPLLVRSWDPPAAGINSDECSWCTHHLAEVLLLAGASCSVVGCLLLPGIWEQVPRTAVWGSRNFHTTEERKQKQQACTILQVLWLGRAS